MGQSVEGRAPGASGPGTNVPWDAYSRYYDTVNSLMPYRKLLWDAFQALELEPGMRLLDAGCGTGNFELFLDEKGAFPVSIEAMDFSRSMLMRAGEKCRHLDGVTFSLGDLDEPLPYDDASFDRVVSVNVLFSLRDWRHALREFMRVVKPGGRVVVTSTMPRMRYTPLLVAHLRHLRNIHGFSRQASSVLSIVRTLPAGVGSGLMNVFVFDRKERQGVHRPFEPDELRGFFEQQARSDAVANYAIWPALANQSLMAAVTR